jgi:hypothetical protein
MKIIGIVLVFLFGFATLSPLPMRQQPVLRGGGYVLDVPGGVETGKGW